MPCRLPITALVALATFAAPASAGEGRGLLWRVVQACLLNHSLTGTAFPCLAVDTKAGVERGFAVVREPGDRTRLVIVPTVRTPGIEARRLRGADAPNYFQDAWASRRFLATDFAANRTLAAVPPRGDIAMAINSRPGRSQDQLHIHLACIRGDVKRTILAQRRKIRPDRWTRISVLPGLAPYTVRFVPGADLDGVNPFDQAATALQAGDDMEGVTIVVMGAESEAGKSRAAAPGFFLMTRGRRSDSDQPHGEGLLDPACKSFRAPSGS